MNGCPLVALPAERFRPSWKLSHQSWSLDYTVNSNIKIDGYDMYLPNHDKISHLISCSTHQIKPHEMAIMCRLDNGTIYHQIIKPANAILITYYSTCCLARLGRFATLPPPPCRPPAVPSIHFHSTWLRSAFLGHLRYYDVYLNLQKFY